MKKIGIIASILLITNFVETRIFLSKEDISNFAGSYQPMAGEKGVLLNYSLMGPLLNYEANLSNTIDNLITFSVTPETDPIILRKNLFQLELLKGGIVRMNTDLKFDRSLLADFLLQDVNSFKSFISYLMKFQGHVEDETQRLSPLLPLDTFRKCFNANFKGLAPLLKKEIAASQEMANYLTQSEDYTQAKDSAALLNLEIKQLQMLQSYVENSIGDIKSSKMFLYELRQTTEKQVSLLRKLLPGLIPLAVIGGAYAYDQYGDVINATAANLGTILSNAYNNPQIVLDGANNLYSNATSALSNIDFKGIAQGIAEKATNLWNFRNTPITKLVDFAALGEKVGSYLPSFKGHIDPTHPAPTTALMNGENILIDDLPTKLSNSLHYMINTAAQKADDFANAAGTKTADMLSNETVKNALNSSIGQAVSPSIYADQYAKNLRKEKSASTTYPTGPIPGDGLTVID